MPDFSKRSADVEIMDDLNCSGDVVYQTLRELEFINLTLGGNQVTINGLSELLHQQPKEHTVTIADLGCGSGDMLRLIDRWASKKRRNANLTGIDANPNIIAFAREQLRDLPHIAFETVDVLSEGFRHKKFDVVIGTLFFHHFSEEQLIAFFSSLKNRVRIGFIINDIHRHPLAYYSIKYLTRLFSKSAMVKYDAPLSVLRAFRKKELQAILEKAGIKKYKIHWRWAFRWQVVVGSREVKS
jgi:2-polyprenyl-3-methyl-5-hydroxy-6-metoxy-1,4-benzoquinol methylase